MEEVEEKILSVEERWNNVIIYGSGYVPIIKMIKAGIIFDFLGFLIILAISFYSLG